QDRLGPDRRPGPDGDVTDDGGVGMDPGVGVQGRHRAPERVDGHGRDGSLQVVLDAATSEKHTAAIDPDGYTILERVIEPDFIDALVADPRRLETGLEVAPAGNS